MVELDELKERFGEDIGLKVFNKEIGCNERADFKCLTCNEVTNHRIKDVYSYKNLEWTQRAYKCRKCKMNKNTTDVISRERPGFYPDWLIDEAVLEEDKEWLRRGGSSSHYITWNCPVHGNYKQVIYHHYDFTEGKPKHGCQRCSAKVLNSNRGINVPDGLGLVRIPEGDREHAVWLCEKHGEYVMPVSTRVDLKTGKIKHGCPKCVSGAFRSKNEEWVVSIFKSEGIDNIETNVRGYVKDKNGKYLELDIYLPDYKLAVECNGSYYHKTLPKDKVSKDKNYHFDKMRACRDSGIHLISLFDNDFDLRGEKIENYLRSLVKRDVRRMYARKLKCMIIPAGVAHEFVDEHHIQGRYSQCTVSYGLYSNTKLVAVMQFNKSSKYEWDLVRYAVPFDLRIVGGAEKLFKTFINDYNPNRIVSYSDSAWFQGGVYSRLGFNYDDELKPRYFYTDTHGKYLDRRQAQLKYLKVLFPEEYSISQNMQGNKEENIMMLAGWSQVYRCGKIRWLWTK